MKRVALLLGLWACGGELEGTASPSHDAAPDVVLPIPHPPDGGAYQCGTGPVSCTCATSMIHDGGGRCSPESLGGASHCCAALDDAGAALSCRCARDQGCVQEDVTGGNGFCICGKPFSQPSHAVAACAPRRAVDRCCRIPGEGRCICGELTCDPTGTVSYEVSKCGPEDGVLGCTAPQRPVAACR